MGESDNRALPGLPGARRARHSMPGGFLCPLGREAGGGALQPMCADDVTVTPQQLKKALVAAGFEVYRTVGDDVVLADRVRENLIMDSGVRVQRGAAFQVKVTLRAQRTDFPSDDERALFDRVRALAEPVVAKGFAEVAALATRVTDPADAERTLDTFYEVTFAKDVAGLDAAFSELRFVMGLDKNVRR
jgi:hypothetical protein